MYVDDEEALLNIAKIFLERTKEFVVEIAPSVTSALDILQHNRFDAIISDYQMPEIDGIEFLIHVRSSLGSIPFILFTGRGREEVVIKAIDNGVDFYLQKGGDPRAQFAELAHKIKMSVERNQAVRALSENEERMRLALEGAKEAHWEINLSTGRTYLSPRGYEMLGYASEEMHQFEGLNWRDLAHPGDIAKTNAILQDYYAGKSEFFQVEQRLRMKNGEWKWMLVRGKVVEYDENSVPIRYVGTHTDITEQKKAEAELQVAKKDWETIFRAIGNPAFILDTTHSVIDANEAVLTLTGKTMDEIKGEKCWSMFHKKGKDSYPEVCALETMKRSGKMETEVVEAEAYDKVFLTSCTPVYDDNGNLIKAIHIATDITENKRLERDLTENRDYLNQIFSSVREGIVIIDALTHKILDINPAATKMIGVQKNEILYHTCHNYICPAEHGNCPITDLHQHVDNSERVLLTADGRLVPIIKYVVPFSFRGRECLLETFIDNSERKKAHDELLAAYQKISEDEKKLINQYDELNSLKNTIHASKVKFETIIETTPDVISDITLDGVIMYTSPRSYDVLGYSPDELTGRSVYDLIPQDKREEADNFFRSVRIREPGLISIDFPLIHKDGREIIINIRSSLLFDENGSRIGVRCVARDVTEQISSLKALIEQKHQIEQLVEQKDLFLTQLAHDLRTPLTPIIGMGPLLLEGISDPDAQELITIFLNSISYLKKMVDDILVNAQLNRIQSLELFETYDLSDLIADAINTNKFLADQKELSMDNTVPVGLSVSMSKPYANLVFRNLINNAVKYNSPHGMVKVSASVEDETVKISIVDTGIGIPQAILDKIWDELFVGDSARHDPLSKGFGLSIVKKIVNLHHGTIEASSEGHLKGSTFMVQLPLVKNQ
ncbi:MAG: PAS domain S-box protein [Methanospirillum sp.]|uniref:hybrid sensor histidine kinase/response regulator n=1 Tax=Methanospirillum sp. TaxID=45200 RepID=UPI002376212C|nr:PAS domain S-box protein [Methanospirillum sp.]MDD1729519.1 PAS domain S-box protein [Methanospirillum sp.]